MEGSPPWGVRAVVVESMELAGGLSRTVVTGDILEHAPPFLDIVLKDSHLF